MFLKSDLVQAWSRRKTIGTHGGCSSGRAMGRFELPQQCKGITRRGSRCSINSAKAVIGSEGQDVAAPLRAGCEYCRAHLPTLVAKPCQVEDALVFYLDFETSGLDIFTDHIVEFGLLCETGTDKHCQPGRRCPFEIPRTRAGKRALTDTFVEGL